MLRRPLRTLLAFLLLTAFLSGLSLAGEGEDLYKHPREMTFPPLSFTPPKATRHLLGNGMVVYLLEDPELPLIRLSALIRAGSVYDPPGQAGLAQVAAAVLRDGGSRDQSPAQINEALESIAARLEFSMGRESGTASLSVPKKDFPAALAIFAALLARPAFDPAQLELARQKEIEALRRSNDSPEEIAYREFRKVLFAGNPCGQVPTLESLLGIQRQDLLAFHQRFFHPNNLALGISGDFKKEEMLAAIEDALRDWKNSLIELPLVPIPSPLDQKAVYHAAKELPQATILLGHLSLPLGHPDFHAFTVLNFILGGGGFNSRLTREVRSNQGLAYGVGSFFQGRVGYGVFGIFCQTKSAAAGKVISLLYAITAGVAQNKITAAELDWAKKSLVNQFIFSFTSSASIVGQQMQLEYDELPEDYLEKVPEKFEAVTLEELGRVAEMHLHPEKAILLVVGKESDFDQPLSSFGPVNRIELRRY